MARKRKPALVSQYLEGISRDALMEYQDLVRGLARRRSGVYALYRGDKLYYVGLARDLRSRLRQHLKGRHADAWDRFSMYLTIGDQHIRELESLVLRIVKPKGNRQIGKFSGAQNLRRDFVSWVRTSWKERLGELLGVRPRPSRQRRTKLAEGRKPVLAKYVTRRMALRGRYRGKVVHARVLRSGVIRFGTNRFTSPSLAAKAACPGRQAINGWGFWEYERAPGDWVRLSELRR
jgi:hypothetical protein